MRRRGLGLEGWVLFTVKILCKEDKQPDRSTRSHGIHMFGGPGPPLNSRGQQRAGHLGPPTRLKHVLHQAYLHLGDLPPDPRGVSHLRRGRELLRVVFEERPGARARPPVDGAVAPARTLRPLRQAPDEVEGMRRDAALCLEDHRNHDGFLVAQRVEVVARPSLDAADAGSVVERRVLAQPAPALAAEDLDAVALLRVPERVQASSVSFFYCPDRAQRAF